MNRTIFSIYRRRNQQLFTADQDRVQSAFTKWTTTDCNCAHMDTRLANPGMHETIVQAAKWMYPWGMISNPKTVHIRMGQMFEIEYEQKTCNLDVDGNVCKRRCVIIPKKPTWSLYTNTDIFFSVTCLLHVRCRSRQIGTFKVSSKNYRLRDPTQLSVVDIAHFRELIYQY